MNTAVRRQTIADLLHRTARRYPAKPGILCGDTCWTFAEFDAVVDRVAAGLAAMGVGHASRVAVLARNSHGFAALRFALARLGAVLVPINFMLKAERWPTSCATRRRKCWPPIRVWPSWRKPLPHKTQR